MGNNFGKSKAINALLFCPNSRKHLNRSKILDRKIEQDFKPKN